MVHTDLKISASTIFAHQSLLFQCFILSLKKKAKRKMTVDRFFFAMLQIKKSPDNIDLQRSIIAPSPFGVACVGSPVLTCDHNTVIS